MHEFDAGGSARMSSSKIWDKRRNEQSHIQRRTSAQPKKNQLKSNLIITGKGFDIIVN